MKKITALLFVIIALTACTSKQQQEQQQQQPQNIYGSWHLTGNSQGPFSDFPTCTFNEDGTYAFELEVPDPKAKSEGTLFTANVIGTYKLEGDKLMMTFPDSVVVPKDYAQFKDKLQSRISKKASGRDAFNGFVKMTDSTLLLTETNGETVTLKRAEPAKKQ